MTTNSFLSHALTHTKPQLTPLAKISIKLSALFSAPSQKLMTVNFLLAKLKELRKGTALRLLQKCASEIYLPESYTSRKLEFKDRKSVV